MGKAAFFFIKIVWNFTASARLSTPGTGTSHARTDNVTWTNLAFPAKDETQPAFALVKGRIISLRLCLDNRGLLKVLGRHEDERIVASENREKNVKQYLKNVHLCIYSPYGFTWAPYKQRKCKVVHKKACKGCCLLKIRNVFVT